MIATLAQAFGGSSPNTYRLSWFSRSWQQRTTHLRSHSSLTLVEWGGESEGKGKTRGLR